MLDKNAKHEASLECLRRRACGKCAYRLTQAPVLWFFCHLYTISIISSYKLHSLLVLSARYKGNSAVYITSYWLSLQSSVCVQLRSSQRYVARQPLSSPFCAFSQATRKALWRTTICSLSTPLCSAKLCSTRTVALTPRTLLPIS